MGGLHYSLLLRGGRAVDAGLVALALLGPASILAQGPLTSPVIAACILALGALWLTRRAAAPRPAPLSLWPELAPPLLGVLLLLGLLLPRRPFAASGLDLLPVRDVDAGLAEGLQVLARFHSLQPQATVMAAATLLVGVTAAVVARDRLRASGDRRRLIMAASLGALLGMAGEIARVLGMGGASQVQGPALRLAILWGGAAIFLWSAANAGGAGARDDGPTGQGRITGALLIAVLGVALTFSSALGIVGLPAGPMVAALGAALLLAATLDAAGARRPGAMVSLGALSVVATVEAARALAQAPGGPWANPLPGGGGAFPPAQGSIAAPLLGLVIALGIGALAWRLGRGAGGGEESQGSALPGLGAASLLLGLGLAVGPGVVPPGAAAAAGLVIGAALAEREADGDWGAFDTALVWGRPPARTWLLWPALLALVLWASAPMLARRLAISGRAHVASGELEPALRAFELASAVAPFNPVPHLLAGRAILSAQEVGALEPRDAHLDAALDHFFTSVTIAPADGRAAAEIGALLARRGRADEASAWAELAVALRPRDPWAWSTAASALSAAGEAGRLPALLARGLPRLTEAEGLALSRACAEAILHAGGALAPLDDAVRGAPHAPVGAHALVFAEAALSHGDREEARRELEVAVGRGEPLPPARVIAVATALGDSALQVAALCSGVRGGPGDLDRQVGCSDALAGAGRAAEALQALEVPDEARRWDPRIRARRVRRLAEAGRIDEAQAALTAYRAALPQDEDLLRVAVDLSRSQPPGQRIGPLEQLLALRPDDPAILIELAQVYEALGIDVRADRLRRRCQEVAQGVAACGDAAPAASPP